MFCKESVEFIHKLLATFLERIDLVFDKIYCGFVVCFVLKRIYSAIIERTFREKRFDEFVDLIGDLRRLFTFKLAFSEIFNDSG